MWKIHWEEKNNAFFNGFHGIPNAATKYYKSNQLNQL